MSVDKFCKTLDIKDLLQLSPEIKNLFSRSITNFM